MKPHLEYLLGLTREGFMFSRTGKSTFTLSYPGWDHKYLVLAEFKLLKLGCRYDFTKNQIKEFDKLSCRTFVYLKEPS